MEFKKFDFVNEEEKQMIKDELVIKALVIKLKERVELSEYIDLPIKLFVILQPFTGQEKHAFTLAALTARALREAFPDIAVFSPILHTFAYDLFFQKNDKVPAQEFYNWDILLYEQFPRDSTLFIFMPGHEESYGCINEMAFLKENQNRFISLSIEQFGIIDDDNVQKK